LKDGVGLSDDAIRIALKEMNRGDVDIDRAPQAALDLLIMRACRRREGIGAGGGRAPTHLLGSFAEWPEARAKLF
jgi:hypothetical protein